MTDHADDVEALPRLAFNTLERHIGRIIATSDWTRVEQHEADAFADITGDPDPMHIDPDWAAAAGPYGRTVVAGMHMMSLLPRMTRGAGLSIDGVRLPMNYGFNRVRFVSALPIGSRFRNLVELKSVERRLDGAALITTLNTFQVENEARPALVAEWVNLLWPEREGGA